MQVCNVDVGLTQGLNHSFTIALWSLNHLSRRALHLVDERSAR